MNNQLVSVVIITFNSSQYIVETLNSIKGQSYPYIELVISDDNSQDETLAICNDWLNKNAVRFTSHKIITSTNNTGVSANLNRGIINSTGKWIKVLAGDDLLTSNALGEFIKHANETNSSFSVSKLKLFPDNFSSSSTLNKRYSEYYEKIMEPRSLQLKRISRELFIPGPGIFFSRELYANLDGFDEDYPFCEEWPFYLKAIKSGVHITLLNKELVLYRINEGSLSHQKNNVDYRVFRDVRKFFLETRLCEMVKNGYIIDAIKQFFLFYKLNLEYTSKEKSLFYYAIKTIYKFNIFIKELKNNVQK